MNRKIISAFAVVFCISCSAQRKPAEVMRIPANKFYAVLSQAGSEGILISCARCGCFTATMKQFAGAPLQKYPHLFIGADTSCGRFPNANMVPQSELDKISDEFYNVVLFKKEANKVLCRIIETRENERFGDICNQFFKQ